MPLTLANRHVHVPSAGQVFGTGWLPPMIDRRDFTDDHPNVKTIMDRVGERLGARRSNVLQAPPSSVDLRAWCSPIENQQGVGSCTAHAAVGSGLRGYRGYGVRLG